MEKKIVSISKEAISDLEAASFPGEIKIVETLQQLEEAIEDLRRSGIIGFDTETKPSFKKGQLNKVSLVQFSTKDTAYLIRINKTGLTPSLIGLMEDEGIKKIGLSVKDDFHSLRKLQEIDPKNFVDLQSFVKDFLINDNSLSRIYAILFDKRISKAQRLTNWEAEELTPAQQQYAALDAYACLEIYDFLTSNEFIPEKSKYFSIVTDEETSVEEP